MIGAGLQPLSKPFTVTVVIIFFHSSLEIASNKVANIRKVKTHKIQFSILRDEFIVNTSFDLEFSEYLSCLVDADSLKQYITFMWATFLLILYPTVSNDVVILYAWRLQEQLLTSFDIEQSQTTFMGVR